MVVVVVVVVVVWVIYSRFPVEVETTEKWASVVDKSSGQRGVSISRACGGLPRIHKNESTTCAPRAAIGFGP